MDLVPSYDELRPMWKKITAQHGYSRFGGRSFETWLSSYAPVLAGHGIVINDTRTATTPIGAKVSAPSSVTYPREITINAKLTPGSDIFTPLLVNATSADWHNELNATLSSHLGVNGRLVNQFNPTVDLSPALSDSTILRGMWGFYPDSTSKAKDVRYIPHSMRKSTTKGAAQIAGKQTSAVASTMKAYYYQTIPPLALHVKRLDWIGGLKSTFTQDLISRTARYLSAIRTKQEYFLLQDEIASTVQEVQSALDASAGQAEVENNPMVSSKSSMFMTVNQVQHILYAASFTAIPENLSASLTREPFPGAPGMNITIGALPDIIPNTYADPPTNDIKLPFVDFLRIYNNQISDAHVRMHMMEIILVYFSVVKKIIRGVEYFQRFLAELPAMPDTESDDDEDEIMPPPKTSEFKMTTYESTVREVTDALSSALAETKITIRLGDESTTGTFVDHLDMIFQRALDSKYDQIGGLLDNIKRGAKNAANTIKKTAKGVIDGAKKGAKDGAKVASDENNEKNEKDATDKKTKKITDLEDKLEKLKKGTSSKIGKKLPALIDINTGMPELIEIGAPIRDMPALIPLTARTLPPLVEIPKLTDRPLKTGIAKKMPKLIEIGKQVNDLPELVPLTTKALPKLVPIATKVLPKLVPIQTKAPSPRAPVAAKNRLPPRPQLVDISCPVHDTATTDKRKPKSLKAHSKEKTSTSSKIGSPANARDASINTPNKGIGCVIVNDPEEEKPQLPARTNSSTATEQRGTKRTVVEIDSDSDDSEVGIVQSNKKLKPNPPATMMSKMTNLSALANEHKCHIALNYLHDAASGLSASDLTNKIVLLPSHREFSHTTVSKMESNPALKSQKHKEMIFDISSQIASAKHIVEDASLLEVKGPAYTYFMDDGHFNYTSQSMKGNINVKIAKSAYYEPTNTLYLVAGQ